MKLRRRSLLALAGVGVPALLLLLLWIVVPVLADTSSDLGLVNAALMASGYAVGAEVCIPVYADLSATTVVREALGDGWYRVTLSQQTAAQFPNTSITCEAGSTNGLTQAGLAVEVRSAVINSGSVWPSYNNNVSSSLTGVIGSSYYSGVWNWHSYIAGALGVTGRNADWTNCNNCLVLRSANWLHGHSWTFEVRLWRLYAASPTVTPMPTATATVVYTPWGNLEYGADCAWLPGQSQSKELTLLSNGSFEYQYNNWPSGWFEYGSGNWIVEQGVGADRTGAGQYSMAHDQLSAAYRGKYVRLGNYRLVPSGVEAYAAGAYITAGLFDGPGTVKLSIFEDLRQPMPDYVIAEQAVNVTDPVWVKMAATFTAAEAGIATNVDGFWLVIEAYGTNNFYVDDVFLYGSYDDAGMEMICGEDDPDQTDLPSNWVTPTTTPTRLAFLGGTPMPPAVDTLVYPTRCWGYAGVDTSNSTIGEIISDTVNLGDMPTFGVCMEPQEYSLAANKILEAGPGMVVLANVPLMAFGALAIFAVFEFIRNR